MPRAVVVIVDVGVPVDDEVPVADGVAEGVTVLVVVADGVAVSVSVIVEVGVFV